MSFNFMVAVTICSDFGAQKIKSVTVSVFSTYICHEVMGPDAMILFFLMLTFKPGFSCSRTLIKRLFSSSSLSAIRVVSSAYLRWLILLLAFFIPTCASPILTFCIMYAAIGWRRQWQPTPVLLPGKSHGRRGLVACSPWGRWGSDTTERLHFHFSLSCIGEGNGTPLQCSCLENPRDGGAWWAAVYEVAQSWTWLKWLSSSSSLTFWWRFWNDVYLRQGAVFHVWVRDTSLFEGKSRNTERSRRPCLPVIMKVEKGVS